MAMTHENAGDARDDAALERELGALKDRYEGLKERKVRAEQDLSNLERQLADLEERAQREYGTSDPEELEKLLAERRAENARMVEEYREHIASVQNGLAQLDENGNA